MTPRCKSTGKIKHPNRNAALGHLASLAHKDGAEHMHAYKCPDCKKWHVGHTREAPTRLPTWHYAACYGLVKGEFVWTIREVYDYPDGRPAWTADPIAPSEDTREELVDTLQRMLADTLSMPDIEDITPTDTQEIS